MAVEEMCGKYMDILRLGLECGSECDQLVDPGQTVSWVWS